VAEHADAIRRLRHHGISTENGFDVPEPGFNYRLSDVLCAIGLVQLRRLEELWEARHRLAKAYAERLEGIVEVPRPEKGDRHGWQAYVVQLDARDRALEALRAAGIEAQIGTYAVHRLSAYRGKGSFPGADSCYERALALPFHSRLTEGDLDRVAEVLDKVVSE
jgi:perosamine synthetase